MSSGPNVLFFSSSRLIGIAPLPRGHTLVLSYGETVIVARQTASEHRIALALCPSCNSWRACMSLERAEALPCHAEALNAAREMIIMEPAYGA